MKFMGWPRIGAAWLACALVACGGGGESEDVSVSSDRTSITRIGVNDEVPEGPGIQLTLEGGSGTYYALADWEDRTVQVSLRITGETTGILDVSPLEPVTRGTGKSGVITVKLCPDEDCDATAWSRQFPYTIAWFAVDESPMTITGSEGASTDPVQRTITPPDPTGALVFQPAGLAGLAADHSQPASVAISASGMDLEAGSYAGQIRIGTRVDGVLRPNLSRFPVSFHVGSGIVAPAVPEIDVRTDSTGGSLRQRAMVTFAGAPPSSWSARSDRDWLVLDTASGAGVGEITYHVDLVALAGLPNWSTQTAQVTISAEGLTDTSFPVTLNKQLPEVTMVDPSGVAAAEAVTVRVTGRGFSQLPASVDSFRVGDIVPAAVKIESDTSATLELPALRAGAADVRAINALVDSAVAQARLGAWPRGTFAAATVPDSGEKYAAVFDASRNAVFASDASKQALVRYRLDRGVWTVTALPLHRIGRPALSPDRRTVYVPSDKNLVEVDAETMQVRRRHPAPFDLERTRWTGEPLAVTHNMRLWLAEDGGSPMHYFDMRTATFQQFAFSDSIGDTLDGLFYSASADGATMYVHADRRFWYDSASDRVEVRDKTPVVDHGFVAFDKGASLTLFDDELLYRTSDLALVGQADDPHGQGAVLSPDGRRIYRLVGAETSDTDHSYVIQRIDVFDTTRLSPGTSRFVVLGSIALPDKAADCWDACQYDPFGHLMIDPTGRTLFWVGNASMVVVPIPPSFVGGAAAAKPAATSRLRIAARPGRGA